jgi:hypothetical protein
LAALAATPDRITCTHYQHDFVTFPGGHDGFLGGEYGTTGQPDAFAATSARCSPTDCADARGDQHVAMWPPAREYISRGLRHQRGRPRAVSNILVTS